MASSVFNFTALGVGGSLSLIKDDKFSFSVAGTFVGKVVLEQSTDGGASWVRLSEHTTVGSSVLTVKYGGSNTGIYRFQCIEYTSGTIETTITDEDIKLFSVKNNRLEERFVVDEAGTTIEGTLLVDGVLVSGGGMDTDFSNSVASAKNIDLGGFKGVNSVAPTADLDLSTKKYVDDSVGAIDLSGKADVNLGNILPVASVSMNTQKLVSVVDPTAAQDAATKNYVDLADGLLLPKAGGTMSGVIAMGTNKITGVGDPTLAQDVVTKNYFDTNIPAAGDAWGDAVDADILPTGNDNLFDLGSPTARFAELHAVLMKNSAGATAINLSGTSITIQQSILPSGAVYLGASGNAFQRVYADSIRNSGNQSIVNITGQALQNVATPVITWVAAEVVIASQGITGRVDASTSTGPFRSPNLAADPVTPLNGDIWYNTTDTQLKCRANGITVVLA